MTQTTRLAWIDTLKGIGIILVAAGHHPAIWTHFEAVGRAIFSFHMPLFFFITGLTLRHGMSAMGLASRALSCVIPYLFLALASIPAIVMLHPDAKVMDVIAGIAYGTGHTIFNVPLWFLPCLAVSLVLTFLIDKMVTRLMGPRGATNAAAQLLVFVLLQLAWQYTISLDYNLAQHIGWGSPLSTGAPWSAEVALAGASYVILGRTFAQHAGNTPWITDRRWGLALVMLLAFVAMNLMLSPKVDLNWRYDKPVALGPLIAMAGIMSAVLLATSIRNRKAMSLLRWFGTSTILILWLQTTLETFAFKRLSTQLDDLSSLVLSLVIALVLPALLNTALKKLPPIYMFIAPHGALKKLLPEQSVGSLAVRQARVE